jgi:hypothetical protein
MSHKIRFLYQLKKLLGAWPCVSCECFHLLHGKIAVQGCPWLEDQIIPSMELVSSWEHLDRDVLEVILQCRRADPERVRRIKSLWLEERPFHYRTVEVRPERRGLPCRSRGNGWVELM